MNSAFEQFDLTGKTVLITGGATGIGFAISRALAKSGAKVMMAARREEVLKKAADELMADPEIGTVLWHRVDLSDRDSVKALSDHAIKTMGGVDIFIGNACMKVAQRIDDITSDALDEQIRANLVSNIELTRDLLPHMRKKKWGRFIYCSSNGSIRGAGNEMLSVYGIVKSGLNALAMYVAAEAGRDGITANAPIIGATMTDMMKEHLDQFNDEEKRFFTNTIAEMSCVGRVADPKEIAGLIQLLVSNAGSYITGALIPIDGGATTLIRPNPIAG